MVGIVCGHSVLASWGVQDSSRLADKWQKVLILRRKPESPSHSVQLWKYWRKYWKILEIIYGLKLLKLCVHIELKMKNQFSFFRYVYLFRLKCPTATSKVLRLLVHSFGPNWAVNKTTQRLPEKATNCKKGRHHGKRVLLTRVRKKTNVNQETLAFEITESMQTKDRRQRSLKASFRIWSMILSPLLPWYPVIFSAL